MAEDIQPEKNYEISVDLKKVRIIFYDSKDQKNVREYDDPGSAFVERLNSKVAEEMQEDQAYFKPNSLLVIEAGIRLMNHNPPSTNYQDEVDESVEDVGLRPDKQIQAKVTQFTVFLNSKRMTLSEIIPTESRIMLLYPTDIYL